MADEADGWYRITADGRVRVSDMEAAAEIAAGDGASLMHIEFGIAEPVDPQEWKQALAKVRLHAKNGPGPLQPGRVGVS